MKRVWKWCVAGVAALILTLSMAMPVSTHAAKKTYVIGTDVTYAPFEFADKHNQYVGIDIDLMQAIAKAEGFRVDIKPLGFNAAVQALEAHQIDGVIAGMQITPERKQKFAMSDPYYKTAVAMAVAKNSGVNQLKDLRGKRVALKTGTAAADFAMSLKSKYGFSTVTFDDSNNMYQDVITGNSVACFDDKPVLQYAIATGLKLKLAGPESKASYYGFATQKGRSDELDQKFNAGLKKVKADGTYAKIVAKYLGNGTQAAQKQTSAKTQDTDRSFLGLLRENWGTLMNGLRETMVVTIVAIFFATAVGILVGLLGVLPNRFARGVATTFIYIFRGLPLMVLALFIYTGVPSLIGSKVPAFIAGIVTLTLNEGAYTAAFVKGGIQAVDPGQMEAARSNGLTFYQAMRYIIMPQALKKMIPPIVSQFISLVKDTSLATIILLPEATYHAQIIYGQNINYMIPMFVALAVMYFVVNYALSLASRWLDRRLVQSN